MVLATVNYCYPNKPQTPFLWGAVLISAVPAKQLCKLAQKFQLYRFT